MSIRESRVGAWVFAIFIGFLLAVPAAAQEKVENKNVPKKVMDALKAKFPKAEIDHCTKEKEGGAVVYDIEFKQEGKKFEADVKEDGTIVNWEKEIAAKDLPNAVKQTAENKYPKATIKEVMEVTDVKDKKESLHGYEITLQTADNKTVEITVAPDGKILEEPAEKK